MTVTTQPTSTLSGQVSARGLNRISYGRFRDLPTLWPDKMLVKLKYFDTVNYTTQFTTTGSLLYNVQYRLNSVYDPLFATAAEQNVAGYLELAQMYSRFKVHASKFTSNIVNGSGTSPVLAVFNASPTLNVESGYGNLLLSCGNPYTVWANIGLGVGLGSQSLDMYVKNKKVLGSEMYDTDNDYSSLTTGNPALPIYGNFSLSIPVLPTQTFTVYFVNQIEYYVEFYGRDTELN